MLRTILSKVLPVAVLAAAIPVAIGACWGEGAAGGDGEPTVVASTSHLTDLARHVAGERAEVVGLLPPGSDPHDYEPRPSDAEAVAEAELVLESGGDIDLWLADVVDSSGTDAQVVTMIDHVRTLAGGHEHAEHEDIEEGEADEVDPHWWQSPESAILAVEEIRDRLVEVDPSGRSAYDANADAYIERLADLDDGIARCIEEIPEHRRKLVTGHDSLRYFAERYGIEVVGSAIPALTTQAQPSAGEIAALVELVRDEDVAAVFPEEGSSGELERRIADEAGASVGGELWTDTLDSEGEEAGTYLGAIAANAQVVADALRADPGTCIPLSDAK